ncbi:hypothetical protein A4X09_0g6639 [Tilletia walkeri]|uniref:NADP-dependent oxidoreductase domain-containing protein n=1 Tax=Tilletia walkeri TaxID=117179 RepID=A0A8X7T266_9BASI|nr:hypothetical protein A4X09_0g6639 [Tilletia walkeri]
MFVQIGPYPVGPIGLGLMRLTSGGDFVPDEEAFKLIKAAIDNSKADRVLLNSGAFYGPRDDAYANLKLLRRFFAVHPELKDKVVVNVKGGAVMSEFIKQGYAGFRSLATVENLREDLQAIRRELGSDEGGIDVHVYEPARRDVNVSVEDTVKNLHTLQREGLFQHIALSEVGAETIDTAARTAKELGTQIVSVEVEYSPFYTEIEDNDVLQACTKHSIPILVYIGRGFLGGQLKSRSQLEANDPRLHQEQFSEENFPNNVKVADTFAQLATSFNPPITPAQLALAWLVKQGSGKAAIVPIPGSTKASRAEENFGANGVKLDGADFERLSTQIETLKVHGGRFNAHARAAMPLFG